MPASPTALDLLVTAGFADYALLDSGQGRKLERFGSILLDRPEAQALWRPRLAPQRWQEAHAVFSASAEDDEKGRWRIDRNVPESWPIRLDISGARATLTCRLAGLWHVGLFPEMAPHWAWMVERIKEVQAAAPERRPRVLNLFAYTGAASLLAAAAGAEVTHIDASKKTIAWARDNGAASSLADKPIRWICEDAMKFVAREARRGKTYDVILVDPPKFGRGPEGEVFELFRDLPALTTACAGLLAPGKSSLVLTVYAIRASAIAFGQLVGEALGARSGGLETGELMIGEAGEGRRLLPTSLYVRWRGQ
jgi:23S rRNA (cytosine1962-C5)-methyltransferase